MNEDEQREALTRFAKSIGDAAGVIALTFVGIGAAVKECTEALGRLAEAGREKKPDGPDRP